MQILLHRPGRQIEADLDPRTDDRFAVDTRRADEELPRGETQRARQARADRVFAQRFAILDMIFLNRAARDQRGAGTDIVRQVKRQFGIGRLAIPFGIVQRLAARTLAGAIGSDAVFGGARVAAMRRSFEISLEANSSGLS